MSEKFDLIDSSDLTDEKTLWKLYIRYVRFHMEKINDDSLLMTPGLFCQYFAINLKRRLERGQLKDIVTFEEIINELSNDCSYCGNPCMSSSCMKIYNDDQGDRNDICNWQF